MFDNVRCLPYFCAIKLTIKHSTMIQILNYQTGGVIFEGDYPNIKEAVEAAVKQGVSLAFADLSRVNLEGANLEGANFYKANLRWANLYKANLYKANLYKANLRWAKLIKADLRWAKLSGADLSWVNLEEVALFMANLIGADLTGTIFEKKIV